MDPVIASIVAALSAGALASASGVASNAVRDGYAALKRVITDRYASSRVFVDELEKSPHGAAEEALVAKKIAAGGGAQDRELRETAAKLLQAVEELRARPDAQALFDFKKLESLQRFELSDVETAPGTSVIRAEQARFEGDVAIRGVRQHRESAAPKK